MPGRIGYSNLRQPVDLSAVQLALFAGGAGRRLGPWGKPKPLLPVCGVPLIDLQIIYAIRAGFRAINVLLGYGAGQVERHLRDAFPDLKENLRFHYHEWNPAVRPYGTGRALWKALRDGFLDPGKPVLTLFVDDLYARARYVHDLARAYEGSLGQGSVLAVVLTHPGCELPYGVVHGRWGHFDEKPYLDLHVSTGMYLLTPLFLKLLQDTITDEIYHSEPGELSFEKAVLEPWSRKYSVLRVDTARGGWLPVNDWKTAEKVCEFLRFCDWITLEEVAKGGAGQVP
jgi:NDP-sugar pyrophosphorylase family protein